MHWDKLCEKNATDPDFPSAQGGNRSLAIPETLWCISNINIINAVHTVYSVTVRTHLEHETIYPMHTLNALGSRSVLVASCQCSMLRRTSCRAMLAWSAFVASPPLSTQVLTTQSTAWTASNVCSLCSKSEHLYFSDWLHLKLNLFSLFRMMFYMNDLEKKYLL